MDKKSNKKIMKHICDGCCNCDCPQTKKMKLQCIRDKKQREEKTKVLFLDDTPSGGKIDSEKFIELLAKAPKRTYNGECVILQGGAYSVDEMKRIMPKE